MKYRIFQVNMDGTGRATAFMPYNCLPTGAPDPAHYSMVYEGTLGSIQDSPKNNILEKLFCIFNTAHPKDFTGRSMSISDVVELTEDNGNVTCHYVDTFGFKQLGVDSPFYRMNMVNKTILDEKVVQR